MNKRSADQIIKAFEDAFQKMGFNFHRGMRELCKLTETDLRFWKQARSREGLLVLLLKEDELPEQTHDAILATIELLPYRVRRGLKAAADKLPHDDPGGRPRVITPQESREICSEIGALLSSGVKLPDAIKRVAERHRKPGSQKAPFHTIKRVWYERSNPKSRFYLDSATEENVKKAAIVITPPEPS